ncbi:MAG: amidohydrolase family protein [Acidobacteriota bacterium]
MLGVMKTPLPEIANAAQAAEASKKLLEGGADGIKVFLKAGSPGGPTFPEGGLEAVVCEARRAGKPVFAHPSTGADVLAAARAGVDVIGHTTPHSGAWDPPILAAMRESGAALTPTLVLWTHFSRHERLSWQEQVRKVSIEQLAAWNASGGAVLFGTDLGAVEYDPSDEYALMAEAGMSFRQVLASLTTAPAERFGESKQPGRLDEGGDADLVVFRGDASKDIRALADVRYTVRGGKLLYRSND